MFNVNRNLVPCVTINSFSPESIGPAAQGANLGSLGSVSSTAYPSANLALFIPFIVYQPITITQMFSYNGGTVSGNIDVGIYSASGTRLQSARATAGADIAQAGTSVLQVFTLTSLTFGPGYFYMAVSMDNTTGTLQTLTLTSAVIASTITGMKQMASAYPLPATATLATIANNYFPTLGLTTRSVL